MHSDGVEIQCFDSSYHFDLYLIAMVLIYSNIPILPIGNFTCIKI
jgi:hypothetical protein